MPDAPTLAALAEAGFSMAQAARLLGVTRNVISGRARDAGIRFRGAPVIGPGCNSAQARQGWATRRARGWTAPPQLARVVHAGRTPTGGPHAHHPEPR